MGAKGRKLLSGEALCVCVGGGLEGWGVSGGTVGTDVDTVHVFLYAVEARD